MDKSIKNIIAGLLTAVAMSNILTIDAAIYAPSEHFSNLKNIILQGQSLKELNNYNYDINKDSKKNVLDLCRMKKYALDNGESEILDTVSKNELSFSLGNATVNKSEKKISIPVNITNNLSSLNVFGLDLNYDTNAFILSDITGAMSGGISYSVSGNTIKCNASVPVTANGTVINVIMSMKDDIKNGTYTFSASNYEAYDNFGKLGNGRINTSGSEKSVKLTDVQNMFPADIPDPYNDPSKVQLFNWICSERSRTGAKAVSLSKELSYVADIRAKELSQKLDNSRPDGSSYRTLLSQYGMLTSRNIQLYSDDNSAQSYTSTLKSYYNAEVNDKSVSKVGIGHYSSGGRNYWIIFFTV